MLGTILQEFVRGALARHSATGENYLAALGNLVRRNNRRYGGYIVHLAMLLIGAGAVGSQVYQQRRRPRWRPARASAWRGYTITAHGIQTTNLPGVQVVDGMLTVNGEDLRPEKQFFDNFPQQPSTKVGLRSTPLRRPVRRAGWLGRRRANAPDQPGGVRQPAGELDLDRRACCCCSERWSRCGRRQCAARSDAPARAPAGALWRGAVSAWLASAADRAVPVSLLPALAHADPLDDGVRRVACSCNARCAKAQNVADSPSGLAGDMRAVIRTRAHSRASPTSRSSTNSSPATATAS